MQRWLRYQICLSFRHTFFSLFWGGLFSCHYLKGELTKDTASLQEAHRANTELPGPHKFTILLIFNNNRIMHAALQQKMFKVFVWLIFCIKVKLGFHCFASVRIGGLQHHAASPLSRINGSQCCVGTATQTHTHTHTHTHTLEKICVP